MPFRRGVKTVEDGKARVQGGMPADFRLEDHGLNRLRVETLNGLVFASFDHDVEPLRDAIGPKVLPWVERVFDGRALTLLGYSRQRIPGNWKLMQENIKDPYHPGLLHTWFVTFGLWRADQRSQMVLDRHGRHAVMISRRNDGGRADVTQGVTSFKENLTLNDARLLDVVPEPWWNGPTVTMITLFPSLIIQQQVNSLSTRHIVPRGPGVFRSAGGARPTCAVRPASWRPTTARWSRCRSRASRRIPTGARSAPWAGTASKRPTTW